MKESIKKAREWMKKKFPNGYCVAGSYLGYKEAFEAGYEEGLSKLKELSPNS